MYIKDTSGNRVGDLRGDEVFTPSGSRVGQFRGEDFYTASGSRIGQLRGRDVYTANGSRIGQLRGNEIYSASGSRIGWVDGSPSNIQLGAAGIALLSGLLVDTGNSSDSSYEKVQALEGVKFGGGARNSGNEKSDIDDANPLESIQKKFSDSVEMFYSHANKDKLVENALIAYKLKEKEDKTQRELYYASSVEEAKKLVSQGAKIYISDKKFKGYIPLHGAVQRSKMELVKYFISQGANVNGEDDCGRSPLDMAASHNNSLEIMKYLISQGANVNAKSGTLLLSAADNTNLEIVQYLVSQGAKPNARDNNGKTPLHLAAKSNPNVEVVQYLVSQRAKPNVRDKEGITPLHLAAKFNKNINVFKHLASQGANLIAKDAKGKTPLDLINDSELVNSFSGIKKTQRAKENVKIFFKGILSLIPLTMAGYAVYLFVYVYRFLQSLSANYNYDTASMVIIIIVSLIPFLIIFFSGAIGIVGTMISVGLNIIGSLFLFFMIEYALEYYFTMLFIRFGAFLSLSTLFAKFFPSVFSKSW